MAGEKGILTDEGIVHVNPRGAGVSTERLAQWGCGGGGVGAEYYPSLHPICSTLGPTEAVIGGSQRVLL